MNYNRQPLYLVNGDNNKLNIIFTKKSGELIQSKFLKFDSSSGKFVGADGGGISESNTVNFTSTKISANNLYIAGLATKNEHNKFHVTVANKTDIHPFYGQGSSLGYYLNNRGLMLFQSRLSALLGKYP